MATETLYVAILLFESTSSAPDHRPLYREDIVTLRARSLRSARDRAERHGRAAEISHMNQAGEEIKDRLLEVVDVAPALDETDTSPADLYSRHFRDLTSYRRFDPLLDGEAL
ncbi:MULTISPECIES: DUF4288 domain-containing protein [Pseudonocardia]|uniref:DUF4288 domain-containing protein n=2 Tax=Pseudonocardia TaxID=1847 RepID=A0A1Y2N5H5_PSEAH|nr:MULTISPECIES: DUF4288 domain-containing protein [Pseudonocardia]OSY42168.1 hypothetical protein BG845_01666 [Pseudonocardia autotrophica]TDN75064.1 uncharacterized protein DUF4288 [Pseudonocardia autotrophica]